MTIQNTTKLTFLILLINSFGTIFSQQVSLLNNNIVNTYSINPSRAGLTDNQLFFQHRKELVGIDGAPEFTLLTAEFRLAESNSAIGFQFSHDQANVIKNSSGYMTYAHHLNLKQDQKLSFGLSLGVRNNSIAFDRVVVEEQGDEILFDYNQNGTNFDANFGLTYQYKNLEVQATALQLFANKATYFNTYEQKELNYRFIRHFVASVGYQFRENKKLKVKPIIQVRGVQGLSFLPEGILRLDYNNMFWLAGHYRNNATWAATAGMLISERFTVGYSAEFSTNKIGGYNGGTHEIIFGVKLSAPNKSSFSPNKIQNIEQKNKSYEERLMFLDQENKKLEDELEQQRKKIKEIEESSKKLDYNEIKKLIEESNKNNKATLPISIEKIEEIKKTVKVQAKLIQFESGNDKLKESSYGSLNGIIMLLKEVPMLKANISGYTDSNGSLEDNKTLSQKRADAVKAYFISQGVSADRINSVGYGESNPITSNDTEEGKAQNRRVEIEIE